MPRYEVDQVIVHRSQKTILESDHNLFCLLTMNHHPVHLSIPHATGAGFESVLVVGTFTFSLAVGLSVPEYSRECIANLEYSEIKHLVPVFVGDTISAESQILEVEPTSSGDKEVILARCVVKNQRDQVVLTFHRKNLFWIVS